MKEDATVAEMQDQSVSSLGRTLVRAREAVEKAPEIREDRVAAARQAWLAGSLNLRDLDLASKLFDDELSRATSSR